MTEGIQSFSQSARYTTDTFTVNIRFLDLIIGVLNNDPVSRSHPFDAAGIPAGRTL